MVTPKSPCAPQENTLPGNMLANAPQIASVTRMEVRPRAATGAGEDGLTIEPSCAITWIGRMKPELVGTFGPTTERRQA